MRLLLFLITALLAVSTSAQNYPYTESFTLQISNQIPSGWVGDMKVRLTHGINDSKGIVAELSSVNQQDSAITPFIGPLPSASVTFFYRIINQTNYPSTPTQLTAGDTIVLSASNDGVNFYRLLDIHSGNHTSTFNFAPKKAYLNQFIGDSIQLKFSCYFGNGSNYFVDIDSIVVKDDVFSGLEEADSKSDLKFFPNPVKKGASVFIQSPNKTNDVIITDLSGKVVFHETESPGIITIPDLQAGIYFILSGNSSQKLVVTP